LRRHLAEKDQEKLAAFIKELRGFLDQYTLPTTGKMLDFINQTFMPAPDPNGLLQLTGSGVVIPGDSLSLTLSASTKATQRMTILSYFQGDQVNVTAVFKTLTSGLNYVSFAEVDVPKKNMSLQIQNFDYINQKN
jgi:hypothetical protein